MPLVPRRSRLFVVLFGDAIPEAVSLLKNTYPNHYELKDELFLVRTPDLAEKVAENVRIKGNNRIVSGVVFRFNHIYSGFYDMSLWDWLGEDES